MTKVKAKKLLIGCFGCLEAVNLHLYLEELRSSNFEITLWISREAVNFVRPSILQFCSASVIVDDGPDTWIETRPSSLVKEKDMMIFLPCSANTLGQAANGLAENRFLTCLLSFTGPVLFSLVWAR
ncbi:hypothetical protein BRL53_04815 [Corynebacterium ulcerans]|uniref:flavoprotein n=1 Tax=Corynebacterium ulcerans TaxID=65058 RepID=UPI000C778FEB|nr:flavoprotein [Corynebacterium ulcerans]PLW00063.1 hypothetical protein BRL53_04815 [Corynebacterium ulcerans]